MTKTCGKCGHAALDDQAQFCNRCGARVPPAPVICSSCGNPAVDNQSRFCTRCGTTFEQKPVLRNTTCPSCGAPDPHGESAFCNRCGTQFIRQGVQASYQPGQAPVIITQRKPAGPLPVLTVPDADWELWNDVSPAPGLSGTSGPAVPEQSAYRDQQIAVPQKHYAHLPLVAEEMKKKSEPKNRQQKEGSQKKGVLGLLKK